jgi:hypothetical protein
MGQFCGITEPDAILNGSGGDAFNVVVLMGLL